MSDALCVIFLLEGDMAKGANQKLKLLYLMRIFLEKTDETHWITMPEILSALERYGITAERKSIYTDIEGLRQFGLDIIGEQDGKTFRYYIGSRQFELAELKLLVDSIQSAKFITEKKSNELIRKIETLGSKYEAQQLQRQVYVAGRTKTMNESIYYNVDLIHNAILHNSQIRFHYFQWNVQKEMELRKNGEYYVVSPWALSWDDENYYMIAFDSTVNSIKHYRVDKMLHINITEETREGKEYFKQFDMAAYSKKMFGMFGGEEQYVKIEFQNRMAGVVIDRFGKDVSLMKKDAEHFTIHVKVAVSPQFLAWVIALGDGARIIGPENVVQQVREEIERLARQYLDEGK